VPVDGHRETNDYPARRREKAMMERNLRVSFLKSQPHGPWVRDSPECNPGRLSKPVYAND
jgi:hypothetical protein